MGVDVVGEISFGIKFNEGYKFPWDNEEYDGDEQEWWIYCVCGYENEYELFNGEGEWVMGVKPAQSVIDKYYQRRSDFKELHPVHFEKVNYGSGGAPQYIIALKDIGYAAEWGSPTLIDPETLHMPSESARWLIGFCETFLQPENDSYDEFPEMAPRWYLSALM